MPERVVVIGEDPDGLVVVLLLLRRQERRLMEGSSAGDDCFSKRRERLSLSLLFSQAIDVVKQLLHGTDHLGAHKVQGEELIDLFLPTKKSQANAPAVRYENGGPHDVKDEF
jgi:hypothetical protein